MAGQRKDWRLLYVLQVGPPEPGLPGPDCGKTVAEATQNLIYFKFIYVLNCSKKHLKQHIFCIGAGSRAALSGALCHHGHLP